MQKYTSKNTSINTAKLPAIYNMIDWDKALELYPAHPRILDYGIGKPETVKLIENFLKERKIPLFPYDLYNLSHTTNRNTLCANYLINTFICSNVLNVIDDDFTIQKTLGRGSFGSVYLVLRKKDQKIYALKTVIFENLTKRDQENSLNEVRILASINHPNVIGYKEAFWDEKGSSLNIVMEYADDGDLESKIQKMRKEGGMFNESLIWSYSIQMIEGLKALHDKKIMHRDIKSANIFLVKDKHQCKIGDMNVSKVIKEKVL